MGRFWRQLDGHIWSKPLQSAYLQCGFYISLFKLLRAHARPNHCLRWLWHILILHHHNVIPGGNMTGGQVMVRSSSSSSSSLSPSKRPHLNGAQDNDLILGYTGLECMECGSWRWWWWRLILMVKIKLTIVMVKMKLTQFEKLISAAFIIHRLNLRDLEVSN